MNKLLIAALCCFFCVLALGQSKNELPRLKKDTLYTSSGFKIADGQDVKLGRGSLPNGDFKYITISSTSWLTAGDGKQEAVGRKWNGHLFKVKKFRKEGSKKRGYTYYLVLGGGNIVNYECDIESAIATGEIDVPDQFKPQSQQAQIVQIKQETSIADELAKFKKLYDEGVLTKEEYEAQKKKLLDKQ